MIGTDYTHADGAAEIEALSILNKKSELGETLKRKILEDNPRRFYGV
jgi:predicted TIM-barrel fold metal-dependent hydrolase